MSAPVDVTIVIVTLNAEARIAACLRALGASTIADCMEVIVSDNGSSDRTAQIVAAFPGVILLTGPNVGYGAGNNRGIERARGRYVLVLNDDTEVRPDALERMVGFMDANPSVGVLGPRLVNPDGTLQPSITSFPRATRDIVRMLLPAGALAHRPSTSRTVRRTARLLPWLTVGRYDAHDRTKDVESVKGAAMMVRAEAIAAVGPFDPQFFLFAEETDWTIRFIRAGWRVVYDPAAEVLHVGGSSTGREGVSGRRFVQKLQSHLRFLQKHASPATVAGYRVGMSAAIMVRLCSLAVRGIAAPSAGRAAHKASQEALRAALRLYWDARFASQNVYHEMRFRHF